MTMKPKFRIGDRVKTSDGEEFTVGGFYGDGFYNISNEDKSFVGIAGFALELVGCGIPAPVLRWEEVCGMLYGYIFQHRFRITFSKGTYVPYLASQPVGSFYETLGDAKAACQAYWQELWDKEMLLSRGSELLQDK